MENQQWGIGNAEKEKAFDTIKMYDKELELIHGEHPHSRQDNTTYARTSEGKIYEFAGHRKPFKIEIEESNYLKSSDFSGDEIRKACSVKVFCDGIQVYDKFSRNYENGYRIAHNFIIDMEENWGWFPKNTKSEIGRIIAYNNQLFKIESFIISQACMMLKTIDGNPYKIFVNEDEEDYEGESTIKVEITSPHITWYPADWLLKQNAINQKD